MEKLSQAVQQTSVALRRDGAQHPQESPSRQYGKKAQPDEGRRLESAARKVRMRRLDNLVEARSPVVVWCVHPLAEEA